MAHETVSITMNVSLPLPMKEIVDAKVSKGMYGSASEFVREAIREKLEREHRHLADKRAIKAKLLEGLQSGDPIPVTEDYLQKKKEGLIRRYAARHKKTA